MRAECVQLSNDINFKEPQGLVVFGGAEVRVLFPVGNLTFSKKSCATNLTIITVRTKVLL